MARFLTVLLRLALALALGAGSVFAALVALWLVAYRDFVLFGGTGLVMAGALAVAAVLGFGAARLFKTTLALPVA